MRDRRRYLLVVLALGIGLSLALVWLAGGRSLPVALAQPGTGVVRVATTGNDAPGCGGEASPCRTAQYAVDQALPGEEIRVASGVYSDVNGYGGLAQVVYLSKTLTIRGGYTVTNWTTPDPVANPTTLDAEGLGRVLVITGNITPTIEGLRLAGGDATGLGGSPGEHDTGGGVYVYAAAATISNCLVYSNTASTASWGYGGGLALYDWNNGSLSGNTIVSNTASTADSGLGGGLYLRGSAAALSGNAVRGNTASSAVDGHGGGLFLWESAATLSGNTVASNTATSASSGGGGGLYLSYSPATLSDNVIINNVGSTADSGWGGGLHIWESAATLSGNTVQGNVASVTGVGFGGGLQVVYSPATLSDNQVISNTASTGEHGLGGGLLIDTSNVTLDSNVVQGNIASTALDGDGGGFFILDSDAALTHNTVQGNIASTTDDGHGGGLHLYNSGATLSGNTVQGNVASVTNVGSGGGLYLFDSDGVALDGNRVQANAASVAADGSGGGLWIGESDATLEANTIVSNTAALNPTAYGWGGGLRVESGTSLTLTNNVVAGNQANSAGSGLWLNAGWGLPTTGHLLHNTIAHNAAGGDSGQGVYVGSNTTLAFTNTIVAGHEGTGVFVDPNGTAALEATLWHDNGADTGGDGTIITGTVNVYGDPAFVDPTAWDYHLTADSAAIDAGLDAGVIVDMDGDPRPAGASYDIGADEYAFPGSVQLAPDRSGGADPGTFITYTHTLTNTGDYTGTFELIHTSSQGWAQVSPTWPITLAPGGKEAVWVTVTVPADAISGTVDSTVITATSQADPGVFARVTDTTTVSQVPGVALAPDRAGSAEPGSTITYTHTLTNTGNGADTFALSHISSQGWAVAYDTPIALAAGQATTLLVTLNVPADAISGTVDSTVITATSQADAGVFASVANTTAVVLEQAISLTENFENPSPYWEPFLNYWRLNDEQWHYKPGGSYDGSTALGHTFWFGVDDPEDGAHDALFMYKDPAAEQWTDYSFRTRAVLYFDDGTNRGQFGVWFRGIHRDSELSGRWVTGYYFTLKPAPPIRAYLMTLRTDEECGNDCDYNYHFSNPLVLEERDREDLEAAGVYLENGRWYWLRVDVEGPRIRCYVDDHLVFDYYDDVGSVFTEGTVGFVTYIAGDARFDNVTVVGELVEAWNLYLPVVLKNYDR